MSSAKRRHNRHRAALEREARALAAGANEVLSRRQVAFLTGLSRLQIRAIELRALVKTMTAARRLRLQELHKLHKLHTDTTRPHHD